MTYHETLTAANGEVELREERTRRTDLPFCRTPHQRAAYGRPERVLQTRRRVP